jgi:TolB-like protein/Tfp pilus assembly protein PilF
MAEERAQRRLAAILAADVVGYSRLMQADEAGTLTILKARRREILQPLISTHHGRVIKVMGDGVLVEFASAVNAVTCAVELQEAMETANRNVPEDRRIVLRVGINLGDVMVEGSDLYGDAVNISARLEAMADPGGVLISGTAFDYVKNKVSARFEDRGNQTLKNIAEPVRVYRLADLQRDPLVGPHTAMDKPSIAVLSFVNMRSDPEQDYFADGLAEDLITDLSKVPGLIVTARHSAFAYKGKSIDIRTIARELGVRYVVEGSVRRAANRVRINVQLIDAGGGDHLWAERFDRDLADIFTLQDEVVGRIVSALSDALPSVRPVSPSRPANIEAYDLFVRGRLLSARSLEGNRAALALLARSIEIDPNFAEAHAWLATCHYWAWAHFGEAQQEHRILARAAAEKAVALDARNASAHTMLGYILLFDSKLDESAAEFATALRVNPNHADAWMYMADLRVTEGRAAEAFDCVNSALRLNPHPPDIYFWMLGYVLYALGRYEDAIKTLRQQTPASVPQRTLAASLAQLGRFAEAKEEARIFMAMSPGFSIQRWADAIPFRREADRQHFIDGYLKAGLPR